MLLSHGFPDRLRDADSIAYHRRAFAQAPRQPGPRIAPIALQGADRYAEHTRPFPPRSARCNSGAGRSPPDCASSAWSCWIASSRASRSPVGGSIQARPSVSSRRCACPPCLRLPLWRACSMRISRMACAAAPKKWRRPSQPGSSVPHQAEIRLVDQGRRLKGLAGLEPGCQRRGQAAQLRVENRQQFRRRLLRFGWIFFISLGHERKNFRIFGPPAAPFSDGYIAGVTKLAFFRARSSPGATYNRHGGR